MRKHSLTSKACPAVIPCAEPAQSAVNPQSNRSHDSKPDLWPPPRHYGSSSYPRILLHAPHEDHRRHTPGQLSAPLLHTRQSQRHAHVHVGRSAGHLPPAPTCLPSTAQPRLYCLQVCWRDTAAAHHEQGAQPMHATPLLLPMVPLRGRKPDARVEQAVQRALPDVQRLKNGEALDGAAPSSVPSRCTAACP